MNRGHHEAADMVEKKMQKYQGLLECAVTRRTFQVDHRQRYHPYLGTQFLRGKTTRREREREKNEMEENGLWWRSELKETF